MGKCPGGEEMEYFFYIIGILIAIISVFVKIFNIKFDGIELHKVNPRRVTIVEKTFGDYPEGQTEGVRRVILNPGLHFMIKISPFYVVKYPNLPMFKFSIEPLAGMEEDWSDWENKPRHPIDEVDWDTVSGVELEGGSMALVEFLLVFSIFDPIAFLYNNENPIQTMVAVAKSIIRDDLSSFSFSSAMQISTEEQLRIFNRIKDAVETLEMGIELKFPENGTLIKNLYPCPETKKGRALRFDAKQKGKAEVEIATGKSLAAEKIGEGWGKKIKQKAVVSGLDVRDAFAHENLETVGKNLGDKTVILGSGQGGGDLTSMVAGLAATATSVAKTGNKGTSANKEDNEK